MRTRPCNDPPERRGRRGARRHGPVNPLATSLLAAALLLASVLTAGCGGEGPSGPRDPIPADALLKLDGVASGDRAVLLEIGPGAAAVTPGSSTVEVHARPYLQGWVVAVFGPLEGQPLLRLALPDRTDLPKVTVREVATESGELRESVSPYAPRLEVVR